MKFPQLPPMSYEDALQSIATRAPEYDIYTYWPKMDLAQLQAAGAMKWALPKDFGGDNLPPYELHIRYEQLAASSVSTALILTQRDAAVGLIDAAKNCARRDRMLNRLCKNEIWATVGIAQLTTSRQGAQPAVSAKRIEGGFQLNGTVPWCTGLHQSQFIVTGATLADGQQILVLLQVQQEGVTLGEPMNLVALVNTLTSTIHLKNVVIEDNWVLRTPSANALSGRHNSLTLGQTFIAIGLTQSALNLISKHDSDRARSVHTALSTQLATLRSEIKTLCQPGKESEAQTANARLRGSCNDLALRTTQAAVALYKGNALLRDHPAQRLAREAMFLLVWSCPNPVIDCTLDLLTSA